MWLHRKDWSSKESKENSKQPTDNQIKSNQIKYTIDQPTKGGAFGEKCKSKRATNLGRTPR